MNPVTALRHAPRAFVPVLLEKLGFDPAVASSVFFTALTDLFGFLFLLGLASWVLLPRM